MPEWTPDEREEAAAKCDGFSQVWADAATVLRTGGDPNVVDIMEVARKLQGTEDDAKEVIKMMISDTAD